jgi:hypothetical protein
MPLFLKTKALNFSMFFLYFFCDVIAAQGSIKGRGFVAKAFDAFSALRLNVTSTGVKL